jgi:hypothetical protein
LSFVRIASNSLSKAVFQDMKVSQHKRALIEKAFGWMKQTGGMRKTKFRGGPAQQAIEGRPRSLGV